MKNYLFVFLIIVAVSSCKSKTEQAATDTTAATVVNNAAKVDGEI